MKGLHITPDVNRGITRKCVPVLLLFLGVSFLASISIAQDESYSILSREEVFVAKAATREVVLTGYTRARRRIEIVSQEAGRCVDVGADIGDAVGNDGIFALLASCRGR